MLRLTFQKVSLKILNNMAPASWRLERSGLSNLAHFLLFSTEREVMMNRLNRGIQNLDHNFPLKVAKLFPI